MSRKLKVVLVLLLVATMAKVGLAFTAKSEVRVKCTISGVDLSVSVLASGTTTTTWDIGDIPVSSSVVIGSSVTVINDSGGLTENYELSATSAVKVTGGAGYEWALGDEPGEDVFSIRARFDGDTAPVTDDFNSTNHNLTYTSTVSGDSGGQFAGTETGYKVKYTSPNRGLWLNLLTPTSITDATEHETIVTITAVKP